MKIKRILFYTDTPLLGGAENQMLLLAKFLPRDRFEVSVAASCEKSLNLWCQKLMALRIPVHRLRVSHKHDPRHFFFLKKLLKGIDLLHIHAWNPASCRYAFLAAGKVPVVVTEHDPFPLQGLKKWLKQKLSSKVRAILVASTSSKDIVADELPEHAARITVIPHGLDIEAWKTQAGHADRMEFRRKHFGTTGPETIILCVAELHERKGQKYLIEAMPRILEKFPKAKLALAGDGPERRHYQKLGHVLGDRIRFLGKRKDVAELMAHSDLFVLPSIREAFGLVVLEAGVLGLPIVGSAVGGISEILENGKDGILVEPKNPEALAKALISFLEHHDDAKRMAGHFQHRVEFDFDARVMAKKTAEVYDSVLP